MAVRWEPASPRSQDRFRSLAFLRTPWSQERDAASLVCLLSPATEFSRPLHQLTSQHGSLGPGCAGRWCWSQEAVDQEAGQWAQVEDCSGRSGTVCCVHVPLQWSLS